MVSSNMADAGFNFGFALDLTDDPGQLLYAFPSQLFRSLVLSALAGRDSLLCNAKPFGDLAVM